MRRFIYAWLAIVAMIVIAISGTKPLLAQSTAAETRLMHTVLHQLEKAKFFKNVTFKKNVFIKGNLSVEKDATFTGNVHISNVVFSAQDASALNTSSLAEGALYYDSVSGAVMMWKDSAWNSLAWTGDIPEYSFGSGLAISGSTITSTLGTTISSAEIVNGTILATDLASMGCTTNQILKYTGTAWVCSADEEAVFGASDIDLGENNLITGSATLSPQELSALDGLDAALIDTNDAVSTAITGTGTLISGATGAGFTVNLGASTLSGTLGLSNGGIGATTLTSNGLLYGNGAEAVQATSAGASGQLLVANGSGVPAFVSASGDATLSSTGALTIGSNAVALGTDTTGNYVASVATGAGLSGGASGAEGSTLTLTLDQDVAASWTNAHTWTLAGTETNQTTLSLTGTDANQAQGVTVTNGTTSGNQYGVYIDNVASTGTTEAHLVIDNSDTDTAVTAAIQIVDAGGGFTNIIDNAGTGISGTELNRLDGGITFGELTDSGTLTAASTDINGGAIDGTAIGASSASSGSFTTLAATGATIIGDNSATVAIDSNDWDISTTGALTGVAFDANGTGNSLSNVDNADLTDDTLDFDKIADSLTFDAATTFSRSSSSNENTLSLSISNSGGTAGTDQLFVISNAASSNTSGDTTTEALLLLDQADTTTSGTTAVSDALLITNSGGSTLTDAIQIGSGTQVIANAINIASTGVTTDFSLQNGETIDNNTDGTLTLTIAANGTVSVATGNLKVGNGTPDLTLDGEDAYVEGTLEIDGNAQVDGSFKIGGGTTITKHLSGTATFDAPSLSANSCGNHGTITVTGAVVGDAVIAVPQETTSGIEDLNLSWSAYVSGSDTVTIRACSAESITSSNAGSQTWRADVWQH
ncbi:MAG: hypothetical protein KIH62_004375 [Candidatus Kerfeldbacteria bacterium]|nr:hypothetical protein [Candidatus Kerfeldbacteria bacterium]